MASQLVTLIPSVELPSYYFRGRLAVSRHQDVPFLAWPGGRPCILANLYILELLRRKLSTRGRGGTLRQYSHNLSHLLRYCSANHVDILSMTDDRFTHFVNCLRAERSPLNLEVPLRGPNARIAIGRNCLDFLSYVGQVFADPSFVGPTGRIRAEKKSFEIVLEGSGRRINRDYWTHHSLDVRVAQRRRSPIDAASIADLYKAIVKAGHSDHQIRRRQCFLRVLEMLAPRVGEVALIRVSEVLAAARMKRPMLQLTTLKTGNRESTRFVPVLRQDLAELLRYIKVHRRAILKRTLGVECDHDWLFISETTGHPISPRTLSNEIGLLRAVAGIERQTCAHMFRNRFITKMLIWIIEQYDLQNPDQLRKALLSSETLKREVTQWTGHKSTRSLDPYIDLAFKEFTAFSKVLSAVELRRAYETFDVHLEALISGLGNNMSIDEFKRNFEELRAHKIADIDGLRDEH